VRITDPDQLAAHDALLADVNKAVKSAGVTQLALAEALDISPQFVCDLLGGRRKLSPGKVNAIGKAVGVHPVRWRQWQALGARAAGWNIATRKAHPT